MRGAARSARDERLVERPRPAVRPEQAALPRRPGQLVAAVARHLLQVGVGAHQPAVRGDHQHQHLGRFQQALNERQRGLPGLFGPLLGRDVAEEPAQADRPVLFVQDRRHGHGNDLVRPLPAGPNQPGLRRRQRLAPIVQPGQAAVEPPPVLGVNEERERLADQELLGGAEQQRGREVGLLDDAAQVGDHVGVGGVLEQPVVAQRQLPRLRQRRLRGVQPPARLLLARAQLAERFLQLRQGRLKRPAPGRRDGIALQRQLVDAPQEVRPLSPSPLPRAERGAAVAPLSPGGRGAGGDGGRAAQWGSLWRLGRLILPAPPVTRRRARCALPRRPPTPHHNDVTGRHWLPPCRSS